MSGYKLHSSSSSYLHSEQRKTLSFIALFSQMLFIALLAESFTARGNLKSYRSY
jgi:hypothetical protein